MARGGPARVSAAAQVFVDDLEAPTPTEDDAHHLTRVLRLRPGETVLAGDGRGRWRSCRFTGLSGAAPGRMTETLLEPDGPVEYEPPPSEPVTMGFVPVKGDRPEWVVQKLTEIGVDRVVVLRSVRSVVRWDDARAGRALERLRRISREAAAQSRRAWVPDIEGVWSVPGWAGALAPEPLLLADPAGTAPDGRVLALAVGPEGGWEPDELRIERAVAVSLGPTILRAETAAVVAAALLCALRDRRFGPGDGS